MISARAHSTALLRKWIPHIGHGVGLLPHRPAPRCPLIALDPISFRGGRSRGTTTGWWSLLKMTSDRDEHLGGRSRLQRIAILAFAIIQILATLLPSMGIGEPIGDRSDSVQTVITPAGWAFSIWGLLFAGSLVFAIYQLLPAQRASPLLAKIGWPSAGAFLGNAVWAIYVQFANLSFISVLIISFTLLCLLACYRSFASSAHPLSRGEQFFVALPLSALTAWLTAATIVNIAAALTFHGIGVGNAAPVVGAAVVTVGGLIASAAIWNSRGNPWYALVFLWALGGIYSGNSDIATLVAVAAASAALLVVAVATVRLTEPRNRSWWFGEPAIRA